MRYGCPPSPGGCTRWLGFAHTRKSFVHGQATNCTLYLCLKIPRHSKESNYLIIAQSLNSVVTCDIVIIRGTRGQEKKHGRIGPRRETMSCPRNALPSCFVSTRAPAMQTLPSMAERQAANAPSV
eukprot:8284271-Lingulodinium_polyedra.AAC.1